MTQPRKSRVKSEPVESAPPALEPSYICRESILGLRKSDDAQQALNDMQEVHGRILQEPWITRDALVKWAVVAWGEEGSVDRLNAAVDTLQQTGRILTAV